MALSTAILGALAVPLHAVPPQAAEVPDFKVRVQVVSIDGKAPSPDQTFKLEMNAALDDNGEALPIEFKGADWSPYIASTRAGIQQVVKSYPTSYNRFYWQVRVNCTLTPLEGRTRLTVESVIDGQNGRRGEISVSEAELYGPKLGLLLWTDSPVFQQGMSVHIDTLAGHEQRVYARALKGVLLPPEQRPRKIIFGDRYLGGDNDLIHRREGTELLMGLGINAFEMLPSRNKPTRAEQEAVRNSVLEAGASHIWGSIYSPPGPYFDFRPPAERQRDLAQWVHSMVDPLTQVGWKPQDVAFWVTADEPGWYYPTMYDEINNNPLALAEFREYLKQRGLQPADLGGANWDAVKLLGRRQYSQDDAAGLPARRLFYWSNRFVPWASARYFAEVTRAYEEALYPKVPVMINFNNFLGRMYTPGAIANNPERKEAQPDANSAMGNPDWLEFGRQRGVTSLATEDWFGDEAAPQWSFYAARLRSAAELGGVEWSALVVPRVAGQRPGGITQKILTLVGHGATKLWLYTFGPEHEFPGNCYSENPFVLKGIAAAARMTAAAEDLLPGQQRPPQVAILSPQSAQFWDMEKQERPAAIQDAANTSMSNRQMAYLAETYHLYLALQHANVPVQFVDEQQLADGALGEYKVLYVTAPDVPDEAMAGLLRWVQGGGTLVTVAGTGLFDRYHQPSTALRTASGVTVETPLRMPIVSLADVAANGSLQSAGGALAVFGEREKLAAADARVLATFEDGSPALTEKVVGKGSILRFACYPGISYRKSATTTKDKMASGFSDAWRALIVGPVGAAKAGLPVRVDKPLIEAPALYSASGDGVVVTVLNWSGEPQEVQLNVAVTKQVRAVASVQRGDLKFQESQGHIALRLPVGDVDIVKIYYQK